MNDKKQPKQQEHAFCACRVLAPCFVIYTWESFNDDTNRPRQGVAVRFAA
jgi:hypothetical protein